MALLMEMLQQDEQAMRDELRTAKRLVALLMEMLKHDGQDARRRETLIAELADALEDAADQLGKYADGSWRALVEEARTWNQ